MNLKKQVNSFEHTNAHSKIDVHQLEVKAKNFTAGGVADCVAEWQKLTSDKEVLQIARGDKIDFVEAPPPKHTSRPCSLSADENLLVKAELQNLLDKGIIKRTHHEKREFVSSIFSRPKPDGSIRVMINLKPLNKFIQKHHFKMDTIKTVLRQVTPGCYMATLDLKHAYHSVKIDESYQCYLKFEHDKELYQYTCYPNGLGPCPRRFTKLFKPPLSHLRMRGIYIVGYIDDFFTKGTTRHSCTMHLKEIIELFEKLGFTVSPGKSMLDPDTKAVFLGFLIDSVKMIVTLTPEKIEDLTEVIDQALEKDKKGKNTIRFISKVIGKIVAALHGSLEGTLHYRFLEACKNSALAMSCRNYDAVMSLTHLATQELLWWKNNIFSTFAPIRWPPITQEIATDASSLIGWGATCGSKKTGGAWSAQETDIHITVKERIAVYYAIRSFLHTLKNSHVRVLTDSATAVAVINKMGSTRSPSCNIMAQKIWKFCLQNHIYITCAHIPGVDNVIPDKESRKIYKQAEWMLDKDIYLHCVQRFSFSPTIDCFASRINTQHEHYASRRPDPFAKIVDAFSFNWATEKCYIFPPFSVVSRVLQKIRTDAATVLMVLPKWPTQAWWPDATEMMVGKPYIIRPSQRNLHLPNNPNEIHPMHKKLHLMVCLLSGKATENRV